LENNNCNESITLPLVSDGTYNFIVDWGDGNTSNVTTYNSANITHTYITAAYYNVTMNGTIEGWSFYEDSTSRTKIYDITQWGDFKFQGGTDNRYFYRATNLYISATDAPDMSNVTDMRYIFGAATSLEDSNLSHWNTSTVTNMGSVFQNPFGSNDFSGDISGWDTSSVTDMSNMFYYNTVFNQDLDQWDVSSVIEMDNMFYRTSAFNGNISSWNVSSVQNMESMFRLAGVFNQDLDQWDTSSVTNMIETFFQAFNFNSNISTCNTSSVTNMNSMFYYAQDFNQPINSFY